MTRAGCDIPTVTPRGQKITAQDVSIQTQRALHSPLYCSHPLNPSPEEELDCGPRDTLLFPCRLGLGLSQALPRN